MRKVGLHLLALMLLILTSWQAAAQTAAPLCDDALWNQMVQRSRLQGQVDITKAENLIYKADSILQYTCFNRFMDVARTNMTYYFNPTFIDSAIKPIVDRWIADNYNHTAMGGRIPSTVTYAAASGSNYTCDMMARVWENAKCLNVDQIAPGDTLTGVFEFMLSPDPRALPTACVAGPTAPYGNAPVTSPVPPISIGTLSVPPPPPTGGTFDCGAILPTGRVVDLSTVDVDSDSNFPWIVIGTNAAGQPISSHIYNEKVCANAACTYWPDGVDAGHCIAPY